MQLTTTPPAGRPPESTNQDLEQKHNRVALIITVVAISMFTAVIALMFLIHHLDARPVVESHAPVSTN